MEIRQKHIAIIGAERSGVSAAKLIQKLGGYPFVSDFSSEEKVASSTALLRELNIPYEVGGHSDKVLGSDFIVVSPGVPSDAPIIKVAKERGIAVIGEIELAASFCKGSIIAITGTNGKTTTTSLMGHVLTTAGISTFIAGNIGLPLSEIVLDVPEDGVVALEVSSFQLDTIRDFKPEISMILNITPDHLNRYNYRFEDYRDAKFRVFMNQNGGDILIINADNESLHAVPDLAKTKVRSFSTKNEITDGCYLQNSTIIYKEAGALKFSIDTNELLLKGEHNYANVMAVIIASYWLAIDGGSLAKALRSFTGVEHRLEPVAVIKGISFINDSKATNVDSVYYALRSYTNKLLLILGGQDKGNDYAQIEELVLQNVKKIYAIGASADKVINFFDGKVPVEKKADLKACVKSGIIDGSEGDIVLLSPACASFDMFKNYEHRGQEFKKAVMEILQ